MRHAQIAFILVILGDLPVLAIPAFPGAEGFGSETPGGRGGKVIEVTTLDDSGVGSFRAACEVSGKRIVVFCVGGTIVLESGINIKNAFITIAGQTAPGGGICLRNTPSNSDACITVHTHDVVIRFLRIRPGPSEDSSCCLDGIQFLNGCYNMILDHCSVSWAVDEVVSTWYDPHDLTIQWCIISEALYRSTHNKGPHSMGILLGSEGCRDVSLHHNLLAHHNERNPRIKTSGVVDVVNNVMYDPGGTPSVITDDYAKVPVNYVGNCFKPGPSSAQGKTLVSASDQGGFGFEIYVQGNITPNRPRDDMDETLVVRSSDRDHVVSQRHDAPPVTILSALDAVDQVLNKAGATYPTRDAVDMRIIGEVKTGTGRIIDHPFQVGGWPTLATGTPSPDTDHDGMPDEWEFLHGLNSVDPLDAIQDPDADGYTNVEEYLNELVAGVVGVRNKEKVHCKIQIGEWKSKSLGEVDVLGRKAVFGKRNQATQLIIPNNRKKPVRVIMIQ